MAALRLHHRGPHRPRIRRHHRLVQLRTLSQIELHADFSSATSPQVSVSRTCFVGALLDSGRETADFALETPAVSFHCWSAEFQILSHIYVTYKVVCVCFWSISGTTEADICGFFNGALLAVNAQTGYTDLSLASDKPQLLPVERCEGLQENSRHCFLDLRSHEWVVLCLKLDGKLVISRVPKYHFGGCVMA